MLRRILRWLLIVVAVLLVLLAIFCWYNRDIIHRVFLGGYHVHETLPPALPASLPHPAVLVFSKTNAFHHEEGIPAANALLAKLAKDNGWGYFQTENSAAFSPEILARFDTVVFNNVTGDVLSSAQQGIFKTWIEQGGGFLGIHAAGDDSHEGWKWYADTLIGAHFKMHTMAPEFQEATVHMESPAHPVNVGLPASWRPTEEWYTFHASPRLKGYSVLMTVDEKTFNPEGMFGQDLRMGNDHPVVWWHCQGKGRVIYSALGHLAKAYAAPEYQRLLANAVRWTARTNGNECSAAK